MQRIVVASAIGACLALCFTGCDPARFPGPIAARLDDDGLQFAVCDNATIDYLYVGEMPNGVGSWVTILEATGSAEIKAGATFSSATVPFGLSATTSERSAFESGTVFVNLQGDSGEGEVNWELEADIRSLESARPEWVLSNGDTRADPCSVDPDAAPGL